ncbi:hypothetical protein MFLAVUS_010151 [Mucor flavus]|uniref:Exonuclease 1 n=1 Tax=Mucor flavus TaxID=439312 RepID=A0ABP9ZC08_9FUNG
MGIQGLIPLLKSVQKPVKISEYAGLPVAVDGYCWLRKGAYGCSSELGRGIETNIYVKYFMNMVNMLRFYKVIPIIVFDGQKLSLKKARTEAHASSRSDKLNQGKELLNDGKVTEANKLFQQSISITPSMVANVIKELDKYKIQHIVSPYETAPQLTYMLKCDQVKAVITENSNLLAFGCSNVIFKMDRTGEGIQIACKDVFNRFVGITNSEQLRYMCILSGCDYLPCLPGIGLRKAQTIIKERKTFNNTLQFVQNRFPKEYSEKFVKADAAFLYQFVFDSASRTYVRLNPLPKDIKVDLLSGLGESPQNHEIPLLESNNAIHSDSNRMLKESTDPFVHLNPSEFNEFEFDDSTLQEIELLLQQVEPVAKSCSPPSISPAIPSSKTSSKPSSKPSSHMTGLRYNSPASNVKSSIPPASPKVNKELTNLMIQSGCKFTVFKDESPKKKPFFCARAPPPAKRPFFCAHSLPPPQPKPQTSFEPAIQKENVGYTKQQSAPKRKSLTDPDFFEKVKKSFAFSDVSTVRRGLSKK